MKIFDIEQEEKPKKLKPKPKLLGRGTRNGGDIRIPRNVDKT